MTVHERCRRIAARLDAGDMAVTKEEPEFIALHRGEIWRMREHVRALAAKRKQREAPTVAEDDDEPKKPMDDPVAPEDVDDDDDVDDEKDDSLEQTTRVCPRCAGKGRDHSGATCRECNGSGRVPIPKQPGDDDDDDGDEEDEFEARWYEFENEE
jgi:hypothetical protein